MAVKLTSIHSFCVCKCAFAIRIYFFRLFVFTLLVLEVHPVCNVCEKLRQVTQYTLTHYKNANISTRLTLPINAQT